MSKEYILDVLQENKTYNEIVVSLWSGEANYQDYLVSSMLIMGYDLRQTFGDLSLMDLGQSREGTNKVIQLHGKDKSLIFWYTGICMIPILASYDNGSLSFTLYNHENKSLKEHIDNLSSEVLGEDDESVFSDLLEMVTSDPSPLVNTEKVSSYKLNDSDILSILVAVMDDCANMTTDIGRSLTDILELLNSESNHEFYLKYGSPEQLGGLTVGHYLPKFNYSANETDYSNYKRFISNLIRLKNRSYSDGNRIVLSKDFSEIEVYDDRGLSYPVSILQLEGSSESNNFEHANKEFYESLDYNLEIAKRANEIYVKLEDVSGIKFVSAELLKEEVKIDFNKSNWDTGRAVWGTINFSLDSSDYTIILRANVKEFSQKLKLNDEDTLTIPASTLCFSKTLNTSLEGLSQKVSRGIEYVESVDLESMLRDNNLLG